MDQISRQVIHILVGDCVRASLYGSSYILLHRLLHHSPAIALQVEVAYVFCA